MVFEFMDLRGIVNCVYAVISYCFVYFLDLHNCHILLIIIIIIYSSIHINSQKIQTFNVVTKS